MSTFTAQVKHREGVSAIHLAGYLSAEAADVVEEALQQVADAGKVLLVFQEEGHINSAGLVMLFDLIMPLLSQGKKVRIAHPAKHFRRVLHIMGLSKYVEVFETEEQAIAGW